MSDVAKKAWIVSVNMGYGHQRTAFPLKDLAFGGKIVNANDYPGILEKDRKIWETTREGYEFVSKFKKIPLIGQFIFFVFDYFQRIISFYPNKDLSEPSFQLKQTFSLIKKGWGRHFVEKLSFEGKNIPLISTFFVPAFMAEYFDYPGDIFCIVCDADVARAWAPFDPKKSKINYFVPTERVADRLRLYGIKESNIFLTGYPLPLNNIGVEDSEILKSDLKNRLLNLDPKKRFFKNYEPLVESYLGKLPEVSDHVLTLMFAVGGAGAQKEIGAKIVKKLSEKIKKKEIKVILVAGIKTKVKEYFEKNTKGLDVEIIFGKDIESYFKKFDQALRKTDILWTKPSELSFYSALGLPIIIAPTIGSQEEFNKRWLLKSGFGLLQEDPNYVSQWLFDWLERGYLAEAAMQGFIEGFRAGTYRIIDAISSY